MYRTCLCSRSICRPTSRISARCARRGCRWSNRDRDPSRHDDRHETHENTKATKNGFVHEIFSSVSCFRVFRGLTVPRYRITLAYDGTDFVGWQRQPSGTSVQGLLEDALRDLDQRDVTVVGAGRTDAGVHALEQVAAFTLGRDIGAAALVRA